MSQPEPQRVVTVRVVVPEPEFRPYEVMVVAPGTDKPYIAGMFENPEFVVELTVMSPFAVAISVDFILPGASITEEAPSEAYCEICEGLVRVGPNYLRAGYRFGSAYLKLDEM